MDASTRKSRRKYGIAAYIRFVGLSVFGLFLFFAPISIGGTRNIPLGYLIELIKTNIPQSASLFALLIAVIGGLLPWFDKSYKNGLAAFVISIFRILGIPVSLMAFFSLGPGWLLAEKMLPFVWDKIVVEVTVIVAIGSIFLTFIISFGFLEFVGMIMRPLLRPLFKVPGRAAIDAVASFVGSFSVAIYLTNKLYNEGKYNNKEASIIITGFSTVSATFMIVVARTAGFMDIWNFYFFSTLLITFIVTALVVRIWPISQLDESYIDGKGKPEIAAPGNLFMSAVFAGLDAASESTAPHKRLWENLRGGIMMCFTLTPCIASIATLAFVLVNKTSVFDIIGLIFVPITYLLSLIGLPEHLEVAKACSMILGEMFVPNTIASSLPEASKYVVAVVSVSAILFFGGSIPCVLAADTKLKMWQILVIWFERTILSIILAGIVAVLVFQ
jgi:nucleoside recognition membrane protein YjiH